MKNKIGLNDYNFDRIEKELVNKKLNLIDESFTFNKEKFDLQYLIKLNEFLFKDIYLDDDIGIREMSQEEINEIDKKIDLLIETCIMNSNNVESILNYINDIWNIQPFLVGNTRTLIAFLKIISKGFLLDFEVNVNNNIMSRPNIFRQETIVNQKRLTKNK